MTNNILTAALSLPDKDLLARIDNLVGKERETTVELVAHLAALERRRSVYAALGYGSLYAYCTQALRLSEDAACNRIDAARICLRFPGVLDLLGSGAISLSTIRILKPHLTAENQEALLARATNRGKKEIEALIAEIAPRPDVPASVRKLPSPNAESSPAASSKAGLFEEAGIPGPDTSPPADQRPTSGPSTAGPTAALLPMVSTAPVLTVSPRADRPIVQPLAPRRYRVQFTIGEEAHDDLQRLQALLRREIPNGDAGAIFAQALRLLREKVEKHKWGARHGRGRGRLSAPGRITVARTPQPQIRCRRPRARDERHDPATFRTRSNGRSGSAMPVGARSFPTVGSDAASATSWSSTTSILSPSTALQPSGTSRYDAAATISTRLSWCSDRGRNNEGLHRTGGQDESASVRDLARARPGLGAFATTSEQR